uniref:Uncharacterized protein n=1 Tax=Salmo trutta TaxID=8032 RepID=A0A674CJF2_SALTR
MLKEIFNVFIYPYINMSPPLRLWHHTGGSMASYWWQYGIILVAVWHHTGGSMASYWWQYGIKTFTDTESMFIKVTTESSGGPVRKSRIQLQREVFSSMVLSLLMSFEGTMVLNAEL